MEQVQTTLSSSDSRVYSKPPELNSIHNLIQEEVYSPGVAGDSRQKVTEKNPWKPEPEGSSDRKLPAVILERLRDDGSVNRLKRIQSSTDELLDQPPSIRGHSSYADGTLASKVSFDRYQDDGVEIEGEHLVPLPLPPTRQNSDRSTPSQKKVLIRLKQQQEQGKVVRKIVNYATAIEPAS